MFITLERRGGHRYGFAVILLRGRWETSHT